MTRDQIASLVPGGVPCVEDRARLVAELLSMDAEIPEVDEEVASEAVVRAARALLADMLLIDQLESGSPPSVTHVERVARALWKTETGGDDERVWGQYITLYRERARLVLESADGWEHDRVVTG